MILNKLVAFIYNLIGVRVDERIREATNRTGYVVMKAEMSRIVKEEGAASKLKLEEARLRGGESSSEGEICCVCLSGMEEEDETRVLPCLHHFHKGCVDRWVSSCRKNCPVCRFSVGEEERFDYHTREAFTEEMVTWFSSFHVAGF